MFSPDKIISPLVRSCFDLWSSKKSDQELPSIDDFDHRSLSEFLASTILLEVMRDPLDFRYRYLGSKVIREMVHVNHTGAMMTDLPHQSAASRVFRNCQQVVETAKPLAGQTPYVGKDMAHKTTEDLILPLSSDGKTVDALLVAVDFVALEEKDGA